MGIFWGVGMTIWNSLMLGEEKCDMIWRSARRNGQRYKNCCTILNIVVCQMCSFCNYIKNNLVKAMQLILAFAWMWVNYFYSVSFFFFRKWRLKRVPSCSFCSTQTAVIMNGVTSSPWQHMACQTSPCPGPQTCSSSCPGWWAAWPPAPWLWSHLTVW